MLQWEVSHFSRNWLGTRIKHIQHVMGLHSYHLLMRQNFDTVWSKLWQATTSSKRQPSLDRFNGILKCDVIETTWNLWKDSLESNVKVTKRGKIYTDVSYNNNKERWRNLVSVLSTEIKTSCQSSLISIILFPCRFFVSVFVRVCDFLSRLTVFGSLPLLLFRISRQQKHANISEENKVVNLKTKK